MKRQLSSDSNSSNSRGMPPTVRNLTNSLNGSVMMRRSGSETSTTKPINRFGDVQKRNQQEIDSLKQRIDDLEFQLELMNVEREQFIETKNQDDKHKRVMEAQSLQESILEEDRATASQIVEEIWRETLISVNENDSSSNSLNVVESSVIFELQSILTTIQSKRTTLSPLLDYLLKHINTANGHLILSILNTLLISCPSIRSDLLPASAPSFSSHWLIDNAYTIPSFPQTPYDGESACPLQDLLHILESIINNWESNNVSFVSLTLRLTGSCYALFPQWELFKPIAVAIMRVFQNNVLKALVLDCLDALNLLLTESLLLAIDPDDTKQLLLVLFDRIRIPNINRNHDNNISEVCDNSALLSKSLQLLQSVVYILLYHSSNNRQLSDILRNTLKPYNISNLLTLFICLFNILNDDQYINKFDISESQLSIIETMMQMEIALIDMLIKKTSILAIIKQDKLFDEFRTCLEIMTVDTQIKYFNTCRFVASSVISEIVNDE